MRLTYRSAFWEARLCYWRWKWEFESQKSNNFPKSQRCHVCVEELRLPNTKVATATKTMTLKQEEQITLL